MGVNAKGVQQALGGEHFKGFAQGDQVAFVEYGHAVAGERLVEVVQRYQGGDRQGLNLLQQA